MRKDENKQSVLAFRIRIRRLRQLLTQAAARFHKQNAKFQTENQQLTEEYKRITDNFKDLQVCGVFGFGFVCLCVRRKGEGSGRVRRANQ
jgi:hypothetical protein